jgi:HD superfamily phosphohydrolase
MCPVKDRVFRDPVHGLVEFKGADRPIAELLDTQAMQRLRRIKQMGFAWLVYPGAEHSRFGHALGAFHIAQRVARRLELPHAVARHVKVAALLHDVGHGPFSHAWEHVFGGDHLTESAGHERWGGRIATEHAELVAALERLEPGLPATLAKFWGKGYAPHYARKLVSSQLDVDRLDYLLRDGHYSGAGYATYDLDWIIHAIQVGHVAPGREDLVVDYRRGMYAVEQYLFARSYMYAQVYHHKTVRAAEWMFIKTLERFAELARGGAEPPGLAIAGAMARGEHVGVDDYLRLHDISVTTALDRWSSDDAVDPVLRDLSHRLVARRLFKTVDLGDDQAAAGRVWPAALEVAQRRFGPAGRLYVHLDTAQHAAYLAASDEELHVIDHPRHGTVTLSRLLADMPLGQPTAALRLVCAPEIVDELRPIVQAALARGPTSHA